MMANRRADNRGGHRFIDEDPRRRVRVKSGRTITQIVDMRSGLFHGKSNLNKPTQ